MAACAEEAEALLKAANGDLTPKNIVLLVCMCVRVYAGACVEERCWGERHSHGLCLRVCMCV